MSHDYLSHYSKRSHSTAEKVVQDHVTHHARHTKQMKRGIVAAVLLMVLAMIAWPLTHLGQRSFKVNLASGAGKAAPGSQAEQTRMVKPHLHGLDNENQPYNITADDAIQRDKENVDLTNVEGDVFLKDNGWAELRADTGHYNLTAKTLDLGGAVQLGMDNGYELATAEAHATLANREVQGPAAVRVQGPLGTLTADGFALHGGENALAFSGRVHLKAYPKTRVK